MPIASFGEPLTPAELKLLVALLRDGIAVRKLTGLASKETVWSQPQRRLLRGIKAKFGARSSEHLVWLCHQQQAVVLLLCEDTRFIDPRHDQVKTRLKSKYGAAA